MNRTFHEPAPGPRIVSIRSGSDDAVLLRVEDNSRSLPKPGPPGRAPRLTKTPIKFMTSRERILAAIEHRQPDRVPVDLGATPSSGISAIAYGNLKTPPRPHAGRARASMTSSSNSRSPRTSSSTASAWT